ncbi:MAG: 4-(cytidine 5'-diphospho)-2-C-methyl-D-erythritol kinase [Pseudomonadota bacterium]
MLARAKINLALHVTGQRADGYHTLHSLVAFADIGDEVFVEPADTDQLVAAGPFASAVPPLEDNGLAKALACVRRWGVDAAASKPLALHLAKNLPVASGIGGGSADMAALVRLLTGGRALTDSERNDLLALGADVPMCFAEQAAIISGIGEVIEPIKVPPTPCVLVNPGVAVSTPAVFKALTSRSNPPLPTWSDPVGFDGLIGYLTTTRNDLMDAAISLAPEITECLSALAESPFARMSGSGATCFALMESDSDAAQLASDVQKARPDWWVQATSVG